jgi:hypothetical protein
MPHGQSVRPRAIFSSRQPSLRTAAAKSLMVRGASNTAAMLVVGVELLHGGAGIGTATITTIAVARPPRVGSRVVPTGTTHTGNPGEMGTSVRYPWAILSRRHPAATLGSRLPTPSSPAVRRWRSCWAERSCAYAAISMRSAAVGDPAQAEQGRGETPPDASHSQDASVAA